MFYIQGFINQTKGVFHDNNLSNLEIHTLFDFSICIVKIVKIKLTFRMLHFNDIFLNSIQIIGALWPCFSF